MDINKIKTEIRKEISLLVGDKQKLNEDFIRERTNLFFKHKAETGQYLDLKDEDKEKLIKSLSADYTGLGPIQKLMEDEDITEIMINGPQQVYIEKNGKKTKSDVKFESSEHLRYIVEKMIRPTGRRVDESYPYVDFALENGSR